MQRKLLPYVTLFSSPDSLSQVYDAPKKRIDLRLLVSAGNVTVLEEKDVKISRETENFVKFFRVQTEPLSEAHESFWVKDANGQALEGWILESHTEKS